MELRNKNGNKYSNMKTYIKPRIKAKNVQPQSMIAQSTFGVNNRETEGEQLSNSRRGSWGDLWNNDDEE